MKTLTLTLPLSTKIAFDWESRWGGTVPSLVSRMGRGQDDSNFYLVEEGWDIKSGITH